MTSHVTLRVDGQVARVTLSRPEKLNGLTIDMLNGLTAAARHIASDNSIRVVVLSGEGDTFSTGLDFAAAGKDPARVVANFIPLPWLGTNGFQEACWAWRRLRIPVIALIHGRCYGGGLQLALAADFRFTTPDAEFSILEAKWGLIPDMSGSVTLSQLIGIDTAKRLTMTGEMFDGFYAKEIGLVTQVSADPEADAQELIDQILSRSPDSVAATKTLFDRAWSMVPRRAFGLERRLQLRLMRGANFAIARKAGIAKTEPQFKARSI